MADFQDFSGADQEFFDQLLPLESLDFGNANELAVVPRMRAAGGIEIRAQEGIRLEEIPLIAGDAQARRALELLMERGFTSDDFRQAEELRRVPVTRQRERQAARSALDDRIRTTTGRVLLERGVNPKGLDLDQQRRSRSNFVVVKAAIDRQCNTAVARQAGERREFTQAELDTIDQQFDDLVAAAERDVFDG